jgi:hypothetical protein
MGLIKSLNCTQKEVVKFSDTNWNNIRYFKEFYNDHVNKTVDLTGAKTIYISPKCEISREKLKSLLDSIGARVVRDPEKADLIFTNSKYCYESADTQIYKVFGEFDHTNGEQAFMSPDDAKLFKNSLFKREDNIDLKQSIESINKKYKSSRNSWTTPSFADFNFAGTYINMESIEANLILNNLFNDGGIKVYDEAALLDKMGEAVIDVSNPATETPQTKKQKIEETQRLIERVKNKIAFRDLKLITYSFESLRVNKQGEVVEIKTKDTS